MQVELEVKFQPPCPHPQKGRKEKTCTHPLTHRCAPPPPPPSCPPSHPPTHTLPQKKKKRKTDGGEKLNKMSKKHTYTRVRAHAHTHTHTYTHYTCPWKNKQMSLWNSTNNNHYNSKTKQQNPEPKETAVNTREITVFLCVHCSPG